MNATLNIEWLPDDIMSTLKEVVQEQTEDTIKDLASKNIKSFIDEEVQKRFAPIIDEYLKNIMVGREYPGYHSDDTSRRKVESFVQNEVLKYLDTPVYLYSQSSNKITQRYAPSCAGGDQRTRAEHWIRDMVSKCCEEKIYSMYESVINKVIDQYIPKKEDIEEIVKKKIAERLQ